MKIFILFCNIIVPLIMICIGILYNKNSNKKINKILDLFMPIVIIGSGLGNTENSNFSKNKNLLEHYNKKCGIIWFRSGIVTFIITTVVLTVNKLDILSAKSFLDTNNVSVIMLEIEFVIVTMVFISVEFILKKVFLKENF